MIANTFTALCDACQTERRGCATCHVTGAIRGAKAIGDFTVTTVSLCAPCRRKVQHRSRLDPKHKGRSPRRRERIPYVSQSHASTNNAEGPIRNAEDASERQEAGAMRLLRAVLTDLPRRTRATEERK
jgi:hypothetical protein